MFELVPGEINVFAVYIVVMSFAISVMSVLIFSQLALENICILLQQFDQNNFEGVVVLFSLRSVCVCVTANSYAWLLPYGDLLTC